MGDFSSKTSVKAVRKPHECDQCGTSINVGEPAIYCRGLWDGYFYSTYQHPECEEAGMKYARETGYWGEEFTWFQHVDLDEYDLKAWLLENAPAVAERLLVTIEEDAA